MNRADSPTGHAGPVGRPHYSANKLRDPLCWPDKGGLQHRERDGGLSLAVFYRQTNLTAFTSTTCGNFAKNGRPIETGETIDFLRKNNYHQGLSIETDE